MGNALDPSRQKIYIRERSAVFALTEDPRFSFCLYVPPPAEEPAAPPPGLVVAVHHSMRNFMQCRDTFAELGAKHRQVVLAPLFPINVLGDGNPDGYKYLIEGDIRYDQVLDRMIDKAVEMTGCNGDRLCMFGYSGGGHFTHRYMLVHPQRVIAASIGAPGQVTLLDSTRDWWTGVRDLEALFGHPVDVEAVRKVAVQMIVGAEDTDTWEITHSPGSTYYRDPSEQAGGDRIERLRALKKSFEAAGVSVEFELMPGVKHLSQPAMALAMAFFEKQLAREAARTA